MESNPGPAALKPRLKVSAKAKSFVLDTNVLLHDPQSIFKFEDNNLAIPVEVLEELDAIKTEQSTERGRNARRVHRILSELLPDSRSMHEGVKLANGGTLSVIINPWLADPTLKDTPAMVAFRAILPDLGKKDNRIIAAALYVKSCYPPPTILVTKDVNVTLKARAVGLEAQDYLNDKVASVDDEGDYREVEVTIYELQRFASEGEFTLEDETAKTLTLNEYVLLRSTEGKTMPARYYGEGRVARLKIPDWIKAPGGIPVRGRNLEQQFFMDALLDDSITLVTCFGKAGTGKTLLSIGCALHQTHDEHSRYDGVSISRPVMALGKDIGFLPGTMEEKMKPWLQPYFDALEVLIPSKPPKDPQFAAKKVSKKHRKGSSALAMSNAALSGPAPSSNGGGNGGAAGGSAGPNSPMKPYERLIKSGLVEVEALAFIRGRSIARRFFILDEAQQLTPHEVKTVITRISEGSKIVLIGDPAQIDNPYVDSRSNGLVYCHDRMKGQSLAAHVKLTKGERSRLAELAADLL
ncbi:MAG: PhoH family protein [Verrucomicrobia bacterium]|nr:PhoH family protein [Verrucomicrobiota bacterium]